MSKIQGGDLMLFVSGNSIAYATSHTLEINGDTTDTSNKDEGGGGWESSEIVKLNWQATSENLFSVDGEGNGFDNLFDLMVAKTPINAVFAKKSEAASVTDVPTGGWTVGTPAYYGKVIITSLSLNAPHGEYATYTANFKGVGALSKTAPSNQ